MCPRYRNVEKFVTISACYFKRTDWIPFTEFSYCSCWFVARIIFTHASCTLKPVSRRANFRCNHYSSKYVADMNSRSEIAQVFNSSCAAYAVPSSADEQLACTLSYASPLALGQSSIFREDVHAYSYR
ncbi:hypothetical protein CLF_109688 [Clonorchis sinensis]|uniref:Uncharacterized protein n=1 Tax=Clonorchis sinensis TaxID=79923 RepID=G7YSV9_CLOSI|nr:hypothetical protein CLF_109688 [Clonorchis sinensis]